MKNLIILIVGAFILSACKKNDDATPTIVGKWYLTRSTYTYKGVGRVKDSINTNRDSYIQFNADGTGSKTVSLFVNDKPGNFNYSLADAKVIGPLVTGTNSLIVTNLSHDDLVMLSTVITGSDILYIETSYKR